MEPKHVLIETLNGKSFVKGIGTKDEMITNGVILLMRYGYNEAIAIFEDTECFVFDDIVLQVVAVV